MNVNIAELLADQIREEQRIRRGDEFEKDQVFNDLKTSLKHMQLYLTGEFPSYTSEQIRMFSHNEDELRNKKGAVKSQARSVKRRQSDPARDEHTS